VHLIITTQKVTSNVQSVPRQAPYIHAELCFACFCTVTIRCTDTLWSPCIYSPFGCIISAEKSKLLPPDIHCVRNGARTVAAISIWTQLLQFPAVSERTVSLLDISTSCSPCLFAVCYKSWATVRLLALFSQSCRSGCYLTFKTLRLIGHITSPFPSIDTPVLRCCPF
jgi:hypothetical protein